MSNLLNCPKKRDACWMVAGFVLAFAAGDQILDRITLPRVYGSLNRIRWNWERYAHTNAPPEVLFLGCSYCLCGINPTVVDQGVYALTGQVVASLNLSAAAASVYTQHLLVRRIVESGRLPQVIYLEVTPEGTVSMTENWLASGITALGDVRDLGAASSMNGALLRTGLFTALFSSHRQWGDLRLIARSVMLGAPLQPRSKLHFDQRGWAKWIGKDDDPTTVPHATASIADGPRPRFSTFKRPDNNPNAQGLRRAIAMLRDAGVTVRLLEIPLRSTASPRRHPDKNPEYRGFLRRIVLDLAVTVVQPPRGLLADADFFDQGHLGAGGALKFSRWLSHDVAAVLASRRPPRARPEPPVPSAAQGLCPPEK